MADFRVRFNPETEDVELVLDDKVLDTVGTDVFQSWVNVYNEKHGFVKPEVKVEEPVVEESTEEEKTEETSEEPVDTDNKD